MAVVSAAICISSIQNSTHVDGKHVACTTNQQDQILWFDISQPLLLVQKSLSRGVAPPSIETGLLGALMPAGWVG